MVGKESVRDLYLAGNYADAAVLLDEAIVGFQADDVAEIRSLSNTLASWRTESSPGTRPAHPTVQPRG